MVTVSERAKARLLEQKRAANLDGEADGLREVSGNTGHGSQEKVPETVIVKTSFAIESIAKQSRHQVLVFG